MIAGKLKLFLLAACCAASGLAWAQIPKDEGAWADTDKSGRPAPMTFPNFHRSQLLYTQVVDTLTAAGCKQEETETFIRFDCETNPKQWYLTRLGKPEHPALYVLNAESADGYQVHHSRMLLEVRSFRPEPPSIERREVLTLWMEALLASELR